MVATPEALGLLGIEAGDDWLDAVHASQRLAVAEAWLTGLAHGSPVHLSFASRSGVQLIVQAAPLGAEERWVGTVCDSGLNAEALGAREVAMLAAVPDMYFVFTEDDRHLYYRGPVGERLLAPPEDWLGQSLFHTVPDWLGHQLIEAKARCIETGEVQTVSYELDTPSGRGAFEARVNVLADGSWLAVVRDFTATRQLEVNLGEALAQASTAGTARSQFLANVGHELRTPLNGVLGMAEVLKRSGLAPEQQVHLKELHASARLLSGLIDDILEITRLDSAGLELDLTSVHASEEVRAVVEAHIQRAEQAGLSLRLGRCEGWASADASRLRQALAHLIGNAIKFAGAGEILVEAYPTPDTFLITVSDQGPGIPRDLREAIFQPFTQADPSSTRRQGGLGLGLAISRELARRMGGSLALAEQAGPGATFRLVLPLGEAPTSDYPIPGFEGDLRPLVVLMAEDNQANAVLLELILKADGHTVLHALNGREAVELAEEHPIDVALLDLHMPEMDGFETSMALWATHPRLPIIAVTADTEPDTERRCLEIGMLAMVRKPYEFDEIRAVMSLATFS